MTFSSEQLNFFKFSTVVLDEFPVVLRQVFVFMWDNLVATTPGVPKWDDSVAVRNIFLAKEGGKTRYVPTNKSIMEWDCSALFEATIFAKTFAKPKTLDKQYVKPRGLSAGTFHHSVISPTGDRAETFALALDQLRLLRNTLCHQISTRKIDKAAFDRYILLAKDAFTALGQNTTRIDEIGKLAEEDFPTARLQQVVDELKKEKDAAIKFKQIDDHLIKIESQLEDVGSSVKDVKTEVTDVKTQVEDVGSDVKYMQSDVTVVKTQMQDVGSDVKDMKTEVTDVKTQVETFGSDVKDVKTEVTYVKRRMKDVGSDVKYMMTDVTDVKTQNKTFGSDVKDVKTEVTDAKKLLEDVVSDVKEMKGDLSDLKEAKKTECLKGPRFPDSCIPDKVPHFVGRKKECRIILDHLTDKDSRLVNVWGPPGFGKTSVAINVAHHLREMKIPVYFTSLHGMKRKDDLVSKMLSIFTDTKHATHMSPSHWLLQSLKQLESPFVLILDNADDLLESGDANVKEEVLRFIEDILAQCSHINFLLTTRESLSYLSHKLPIHLERVGVLDKFASGELVKSLLTDVPELDRNSIVKECGQVPLAMRLMCSTVTEQHVTVNELLEQLNISPLVEVLDNDGFSDDVRLKTIINSSFQRLAAHEKDAFVSFAVFPGCFGIDEAKSMLNLETLPQTKKIIRSLERKALMDCSENFSSFTIHSLLRSFIDERRITDQETEAVFLTAQRRFYDYHVSSFAVANEKFLTGHSSEALEAFLRRRENIVLSLTNGTRDDKLYSKAVVVLSKAELFLYATLPNEELFKAVYDTAVNEAHRRKNVDDERKLLAAKSFAHWGWFSSDRQTWDHSLQAGYADDAHCPAKLACYFGIHQILCGKLEEGISSLRRSVDCLGSSCDETVLKLLVYEVLAVAYYKKQEHKMALCFKDLSRCLFSKDTLPSMGGDAYFISVRSNLLYLLAKRKVINSHTLSAMPLSMKGFVAFCESLMPESNAGFIQTAFAKSPLLQCELEEPEFMTPEAAVALRTVFSCFDQISSNSFSLTTFNQIIENLLNWIELLPPVGRKFLSDVIGSHFAAPLKEVIEIEGNDLDVDFAALARTCDMLGKSLHFVNDYSEALKLHQHAKRLRQENIGDHVDTVSSLTNIGRMYFKMNNESKAVESFQSALELRKQLGIHDHADTANIYFTLAENHFTLGNYEKAIEAHLQALELRRKHLGKHPITGESLHHVAVVYYQMGKTDIESVTSCQNIAESTFQLESFKEALTFCQQALSMRLEVLGEHVDTANSFEVLGQVHHKMGDFPSAVEAFQITSDMRSNLLGDHMNTAQSYHLLGIAQCDMEDLNKALESFQKALQLSTKCSKGDHPLIADSMHNIGFVYYKMGEYQSARGQFQDAIDLYKKILDKHESTANSCQILAETYLAMGSSPEALEFCQQALTMRQELLGEHMLTAKSFHFLGEVHYKMGDFPSAVVAFQKASDMKKNLLGDHEDAALSYHWLGLAQFDMGDLTKALASLQKALQLRKKCSRGDHPGLADSIHGIGRVYYKMGDYHSAREQFHDAVYLRRKLFDNHESTANSYHYLSKTYLAVGRYIKALEFCRQAVTMRLNSLGEHVDTAKSFHFLGKIRYKICRFPSAVKAFHKASDMRSNLLGDHEDTALSYHWLALAQRKVGDVDGALESLQKASRLRKEILGDHPSTANSFYKTGRLNYKIGDYHSARQQFQDAVDVYEKLPNKRKSTATSYYNLAVTNRAIGRFSEAIECCQQALTMRFELLGEHVKTANVFHTLGSIYYKMSNFPSAVEAFQKASDMRSNLLGDHKDTALSYHWLGKAQSDMRDLEGALESLQTASRMRKEIFGDHPDTAESVYLRDHVCEALSSSTTGWNCIVS